MCVWVFVSQASYWFALRELCQEDIASNTLLYGCKKTVTLSDGMMHIANKTDKMRGDDIEKGHYIRKKLEKLEKAHRKGCIYSLSPFCPLPYRSKFKVLNCFSIFSGRWAPSVTTYRWALQ